MRFVPSVCFLAARPRIAAAVAAVAIVVAAASAYVLTRDGTTAEVVDRFGTVDRGTIASEFAATGTVNAIGSVNVLAQVSGQVIEVLADLNSPVAAGVTLARLDPEAFVSQVQQAEADLAVARANLVSANTSVERARSDIRNAEASRASLEAQKHNAQLAADAALRDLDRARELFARAVVTLVAVQDAEIKHRTAKNQLDQMTATINGQAATLDGRKASLAIAEAGILSSRASIQQKEVAVREAKADVERTVIRALADGAVLARNVEVGQYVNVAATQQTPLFTIARDMREVNVLVNVDEADITKVCPGLPVTLTVDSYAGRTFLGRVDQVRLAPKTTQNVVTYTVVVRVANLDLALFPGMTASATVILTGRQDALRIPITALRFAPPGVKAAPTAPAVAGGRPARVFVEGPDGQPKLANITIGMADGRFVEVLAGDLTEGQRLIVGSNQTGATNPVARAGGQQQFFLGGAPPPGGPPPGAFIVQF